MKVKQISAKKVLNSRKQPTIEITINKKFKASAPSGASTGVHEVTAYPKEGIDHAIKLVTKLPELKQDFDNFNDLAAFDKYISKLGGNTVIALQFALLKAMSNNEVWKFLNPKAKTLPKPVGNVVGGGMHTHELSTDIQEFLLIPQSDSIKTNIEINKQLHTRIGNIIKAKHMTDEGAWIPSNMSNQNVLEFLHDLLSSRTESVEVKLGLDIAASSFYNNGFYCYKNFSDNVKSKKLTKDEQINLVNSWIENFELFYVEDPVEENDFESFAKINKANKKSLICGDDLITTNLNRIKKAVKLNAINCVIIKPNQIGSVIKTKAVVDYAHKHGIKTIISHRSGETMDATISHLAVSWGIPYIKCGIHGKEREAKLNELLKIEQQF